MAVGAKLLCANGFARADRGRGRARGLIRMPYFPQQAAELLRTFELILFVEATPPVAQFGYDDGLSALVHPSSISHTLDASDAPAALAALTQLLGATPASKPAAAAPPPRPTGNLTAAKMCRLVSQLQPLDAVIVDESITSGTTYWDDSIDAMPFTHLALTGGAIGQGMPCAVGAALACPERRVINLQADGSGLYTCQALWTQAKEGLKVTTVVCANHAYGILQVELKKQKPKFGGKGAAVACLTSLDEPPIDWISLAAGFGVPAVACDTCEDFGAAFRDALEADGPFLVVAMLRPSSAPPPPKPSTKTVATCREPTVMLPPALALQSCVRLA